MLSCNLVTSSFHSRARIMHCTDEIVVCSQATASLMPLLNWFKSYLDNLLPIKSLILLSCIWPTCPRAAYVGTGCTLLEGVSPQSGLAATLHCHQMIAGWWIIGGPVPGDSAETTRLHLVPVMQSSEEAAD